MDGGPLLLHTNDESSVGTNLFAAYAAIGLHWSVSKLALDCALKSGWDRIACCCRSKVVTMAQSSKKDGFVPIGIGCKIGHRLGNLPGQATLSGLSQSMLCYRGLAAQHPECFLLCAGFR